MSVSLFMTLDVAFGHSLNFPEIWQSSPDRNHVRDILVETIPFISLIIFSLLLWRQEVHVKNNRSVHLS